MPCKKLSRAYYYKTFEKILNILHIFQVLCSPSPQGNQLPQEEVWSHLQHPPQEEVKVDCNGVCHMCGIHATCGVKLKLKIK